MSDYPEICIPFAKMNGSGNDFVVIDNRAGLIPAEALPAFARAVCRRGLGVGADGVPLSPRDRASCYLYYTIRPEDTCVTCPRTCDADRVTKLLTAAS